MHRRAKIVSLLLLMTIVMPLAGANRTAEWIWHPDANVPRGQKVYFRKRFTLPQAPVRARLLATADFAHLQIVVNGQALDKLESFQSGIDIDLPAELRNSDNMLTVTATVDDGPSAFALDLRIDMSDGTTQHIVTDDSWSTTTTASARWGDALPDEELGAVSAIRLGPVEPVRLGDQIQLADITPFDDYTQWKQALGEGAGTPSTSYLLPEGFEIEQLRLAQQGEDSWVSLVHDQQGRILVAREKRGILRFTLNPAGGIEHVETINDSLEECRGMCFVGSDLWVNANNSRALYRLRDVDGDSRYEVSEVIYQSKGDVGHGRNDLVLGPDNHIYSIHGDSVELPSDARDFTSPHRQVGLPRRAGEGHVLRISPETKQVELLVAGLRNPYGIDFNRDGELFTYDADAEFDMGAPWYRPTRVLHLLPGGDYGWRAVTGDWPPYASDRADATPPNVDIGKGSPTAVKFGYGSQFPAPYQEALFVLDWAYGRVLAVHSEPWGASYAMRAETFLRGRPLNVTDITFGPDGAMYLVTGGRQTQSALYRVRYTGAGGAKTVEPTTQQTRRRTHAADARQTRRLFEHAMGSDISDATVDQAWQALASNDPWLRHSARLMVERVPVGRWSERALADSLIESKLALARCVPVEMLIPLVVQLNSMPWSDYSVSERVRLLRAYHLALSRDTRVLPATLRNETRSLLRARYPDAEFGVNYALSELLVSLDTDDVVTPTIGLLRSATSEREQLHYLHVLRNVREGWTMSDRESYFVGLRAANSFVGGEGMPGFLKRIRDEAVATVPESERAGLQQLISGGLPQQSLPAVVDRPFVRDWEFEALVAALTNDQDHRSFNRGQQMFDMALCSRCHRLGARGNAVGPDLTSVASRFGRTDILKSIVLPSQVVAEPYRQQVITTKDGRTIVGRVSFGADYRSDQLQVVTNLLDPDRLMTIPKSDVESHELSATSPMPSGLLNTLSIDEILDLLAFLESGGNADHPRFQPHSR